MSETPKLRTNRKYGTMKLTKKITVQLSCDTLAYLQEQAAIHKLSYGAALELLIRSFAGESSST